MVVQPDPLINTGKCRLRVGSEINSHSVFKMSSAFRTFENRLCEVIFERSLRVGSEINSHSVFKMSSAFRTFENRLCEVIFERSLREKSFKHWQCNPLRVHFFLK